ncbi:MULTISPECIES: indolepyruvate oxidoreductase subunit beta [unclassified Desulfosporosinus]|uniref:indolepyruvate oxidoreductase subunit beta n=1 Tax=unclassified Desulfosporosinus TaxID=2633794 RepID=UPI00051FF224|nr:MULTISPECIES: indolepyruvate oxidoreductase subunit beta [unclassified Desulfosporosinus]KGK85895.1 indolepyruvate oxidoreductase subunit beta [Desulfosporosinus sp. HMP52]MBC2726205.1 indolepyruvate oxidoreductase subunit beta [Desulfosporosinus sp.]HBV85516.1 indolepyruvate oxidoreductase subunit beta [Desulfosporosinus sp.]
MNKSVMLVGVGGQGTILTSKILAEGLLGAGYDVKMSEIHGMAQRGGSVTTHIKYGEKVNSPIINKGEADVLIAFEKVEALRYLCHLKAGGILIVSDHEIYSQSVLSGTEDYPQEIIESLTQAVERTIVLQAVKLAEQLGNIRTHNIVLLGVLVKALGLEQLDWVQVMKDLIPEKVLEANVKAFKTGLAV